MPIRFVDRSVRIGLMRPTLDDAGAALAGTHTLPASQTGTIATRLADHTSQLAGAFIANPNRVGSIASTLGSASAALRGSSQSDFAAPSTPTGLAVAVFSDTSLQPSWGSSTDVGTGVAGYKLERSADGATGWTQIYQNTATNFIDTGLASGTAQFYRVRAFDLAGNNSGYSTVASGTTSGTGSGPPTPGFVNWPIMTAQYLIGDPTLNVGSTTQRDFVGQKDVLIFPWFYVTSGRIASRNSWLQYQKDNYPGLKVFLYVENNETIKTVAIAGTDAKELTKALIDSPITGNPNWYLRRANGQQVESLFSPSTLWSCNCASLVAGLNSLGQRYEQAWVEEMWADFNTAKLTASAAGFFTNFFTGLYVDNFEARLQSVYINNGATPVTDIDMNGDSVAETLNDYSAGSTAGGRMLSQGQEQFIATIEAKFGGPTIVNGARWPGDYFDGKGSPPKPLSGHPFYGKREIYLRESNNLDFGITRDTNSATGYSYDGTDPLATAFTRMAIAEKFLVADAAARLGKACVLLESYTPNRTPTADDYTYGRFMLGCALLMERSAHATSVGKNLPLPLDEEILELGAPLATRGMGTLNETTLAFTARAPDFTNGVAKFWWSQFAKGIVVVRLDAPTAGVWPSADAAATCTLPAPGMGSKWQMPNAATYTSPAIFKGLGGALVTRTMRSQNTTLNNGADVTTVSLKPYQAAFVRFLGDALGLRTTPLPGDFYVDFSSGSDGSGAANNSPWNNLASGRLGLIGPDAILWTMNGSGSASWTPFSVASGLQAGSAAHRITICRYPGHNMTVWNCPTPGVAYSMVYWDIREQDIRTNGCGLRFGNGSFDGQGSGDGNTAGPIPNTTANNVRIIDCLLTRTAGGVLGGKTTDNRGIIVGANGSSGTLDTDFISVLRCTVTCPSGESNNESGLWFDFVEHVDIAGNKFSGGANPIYFKHTSQTTQAHQVGTVRNNIFLNGGNGCRMSMNWVVYSNNAFSSCALVLDEEGGFLLGGNNCVINHNTFLNSRWFMAGDTSGTRSGTTALNNVQIGTARWQDAPFNAGDGGNIINYTATDTGTHYNRNRGTYTMAQYKLAFPTQEVNGVPGTIALVGGTTPGFTPANWALTSGSVGRGNASDGGDRGVDVTKLLTVN